MKGLSIQASDGEIGSISDVLFEDDTWRARWLVVDTGPWLMGRSVLLPVSHTEAPEAGAASITVDLTKKQVEDSPGTGVDLPVSRQTETSLYESYGWTPYWSAPGITIVPATAYPVMPVAPVAATGGVAGMGAAPVSSTADANLTGAESKERGDPHLRSAKEVIGYYAHARNGDIGHVEDILVEGRDWSIGYFIIDTKNWWPGKMVLIRPDWIDSISWGQRLVHLSRSREEVKTAPEYDQSQPIDSRSG
ncbi:PRC-barrel domain-containing protein [Microvirga sp. BT325]|uniref:PRC-barrel domain-containing protein n=1 Tax=Microvirga splendida TaxID=2795727 RepID=A0ABS0Y4M4_9HYPH|nr:PRC-barrel domain-containing protein [Microvirga splendida]